MRMSVVVAAFNSAESIQRCLSSLLPQMTDGDEVIVCTNLPASSIEPLRSDDARVRWVTMERSTTIPLLRAEGARLSNADVVAFTEDHLFVDAAWRQAMGRSFEEGRSVVGGPVEFSGPGSPFDRAMYLFDYAPFMSPVPAGPVSRLTAANAAYKRSLLSEGPLTDGVYEVTLNSRLRSQGEILWLNPQAPVYHAKNYERTRSVSQMRHAGRSYASMRMRGRGALVRAVYALATPLLVFVLPGRILSLVLKRARPVTQWLVCLPYLLVISVAWALGEFLGSLAGDGGSAAEWK